MSKYYLIVIFTLILSAESVDDKNKDNSPKTDDNATGQGVNIDNLTKNSTVLNSDTNINTLRAVFGKKNNITVDDQPNAKNTLVLHPLDGEGPEIAQQASDNDSLDSGQDSKSGDTSVSSSKFDAKATQRALIVVAGLTTIILSYLGVKLCWRKKRKPLNAAISPDHLYGPLNSSEMSLLQSDLDDTEDEETLYHIPKNSGSNIT